MVPMKFIYLIIIAFGFLLTVLGGDLEYLVFLGFSCIVDILCDICSFLASFDIIYLDDQRK